jgi:hypothetical protein
MRGGSPAGVVSTVADDGRLVAAKIELVLAQRAPSLTTAETSTTQHRTRSVVDSQDVGSQHRVALVARAVR